jgi:ABC-type spermidine/putrescine transport system permease subunit I
MKIVSKSKQYANLVTVIGQVIGHVTAYYFVTAAKINCM